MTLHGEFTWQKPRAHSGSLRPTYYKGSLLGRLLALEEESLWRQLLLQVWYDVDRRHQNLSQCLVHHVFAGISSYSSATELATSIYTTQVD